MASTKDRSALHAYLSAEAHDAWQTFAEVNGVSVTGVLERLGLDLAEEMKTEDPDAIRKDLVRGARRIDADRRRRNGK